MILIFYILLVANLSLACYLIKLEYQRRSPFFLIWSALIVLVFIPSFADPFLGVVKPHELSVNFYLDLDVLVASHLYAFSIMACYFLCLVFFVASMGRSVYEFSHPDYRKSQVLYPWLFYAISIISVAYVYVLFGKVYFLDYSFLEARDETPFILKVGMVYTQFLYAGLGFYYMYTKNYKWLLFVFLSFLVLFFMLGGSRQPIIIFLASTLLGYLYSSKKGLSKVYLLTILSPVLLGVLQQLLVLRNINGLSNRVDYIKGVLLGAEGLAVEASREDSLRFPFYYFAKELSNIDSFNNFEYIQRLLFFWAPSNSALKPGDFEYVMFSEFMPNQIGTMHPTLFGSILADTGYFILPWVLFFALVSYFLPRFINGLSLPLQASLLGVIVYFSIMSARGAFYGVFVLLIMSIVLLNLIGRFRVLYREQI